MSKYKRDVTIAKSALDDELMAQPVLMQEYCELLADAKLEAETAKNALALVRADKTIDVYKNPHDYDIPKSTETTVKAAVESDEEVVDAKKNLADANHHVGVIDSAVSGMIDKKKSLESLVFLQGQNYFSEVKVPSDKKTVIARKKARNKTQKRQIRKADE